MHVGLNAGFGGVITPDRCQRIAEAGFDHVRLDALFCGPHGEPPKEVPLDGLKETYRNLRSVNLLPIWLISRPLRTGLIDVAFAKARVADLLDLGPALAVDVGMEFNDRRASYSPQVAVDTITPVWEMVGGRVPVSACLTNNTSKTAYDFTVAAFNRGLWCDWLGLHPYRTTCQPWEVPYGHGWRSRREEDEAWLSLATLQGVRLAYLEWGWHQAVSNAPKFSWSSWPKKRVQFTEQDQARYVEWEFVHHDGLGAVCSTVFQERDAPSEVDPSHEGSYGMWRADGSRKPVLEAIGY